MNLPRAKIFPIPLGIIFLLKWLAVTSPAVSADPSTTSAISVKTNISPVELTVGDLATYSVTLTYPEKINLTPPSHSRDFVGFELVDQGSSPAIRADGKLTQEFWYRLRADRVGSHTLSSPVLKFKNSEPNVIGEFDSGETKGPDTLVTIRSVLFVEGEPRDIRNIKPIVGSAWPWKNYIPPALAFIALSCLIGYAASWWVKRNMVQPVVHQVPALPPHEMALRELDRLYEKGYHTRQQIRQLHFEFSEIFRRYLGCRYLFPALDWTTEEIGRALSDQPQLDNKQREEACRILTETDLVKFAKLQVDPDTAIRLMKSARSFIRQTAPAEKPEVSTGQEAIHPTA